MKKQFALYILIGGIQYALDALTFALAALSLPITQANFLSRATGALAGYFLNRHITFAEHVSSAKDTYRPLRYILVWFVMSIISTMTINQLVDYTHSNDWGMSIVIKLGVEATLVAVSFLLQRTLVFR